MAASRLDGLTAATQSREANATWVAAGEEAAVTGRCAAPMAFSPGPSGRRGSARSPASEYAMRAAVEPSWDTNSVWAAATLRSPFGRAIRTTGKSSTGVGPFGYTAEATGAFLPRLACTTSCSLATNAGADAGLFCIASNPVGPSSSIAVDASRPNAPTNTADESGRDPMADCTARADNAPSVVVRGSGTATTAGPINTPAHPILAAAAIDAERDGAVATTSGELPTEPLTVTADRNVGLAARNWSAQKRESGIQTVSAGDTPSDWTAAFGFSWSTVTVMHFPFTVGLVATHASAMAWVAACTCGAVMTLSETPFRQG